MATNYKQRGTHKKKGSNKTNQKYDGGKEMKDRDLNDVSWYARNDALLRDAASIQWMQPLGSKIKRDFHNTNVTSTYESIPGIWILDYIPVMGISDNANSPMNVASRNVYSWVRYKNSGHVNYDPNDLFIYLVCMDSAYQWYGVLTRAYGMYSYYSQYNRYVPDAMLQALGFNPQDFRAHIADYRYLINNYAAKLTALSVPDNMDIYKRHLWLTLNAFTDSATRTSQIYACRPTHLYKFDFDTDGAGMAKTTSIPSNITFASALSFCDTLLDPLMGNEDINIMSGDIIKAYGNNLIKLSVLAEDFIIRPAYSTEVLSQIENATMASDITGTDITQDATKAFLLCTPSLPSTYNAQDVMNRDKILNMHKDDITPADTMVATRLTTMLGNKTSSGTAITSCGSEIVTRHHIYVFYTDANGEWKVKNVDWTYYIAMITTNTIAQEIADLRALYITLDFDWKPETPIFVRDASNNVELLGLAQDFDRIQIVDTETVDKLHTTALMSMFDVPANEKA